MARRKRASASYETVAADSGYLSDLIETARQNHKVTEKLMRSPSVSSSVQLILSKFSDTKWDVEATGAKLERLNRDCRDLADRIKYPTRFPIVPFESTIAEVKAATGARRKRKALAEIDANVSTAKASQAEGPAAVDSYGCTRAAAKRLRSAENVTRQSGFMVRPDIQQIGLKRQRSRSGATHIPKRKKLKTGS